jgi:hypothetical protein
MNSEQLAEHPHDRNGQDYRDDGQHVSAHDPFWHGAEPRNQRFQLTQVRVPRRRSGFP